MKQVFEQRMVAHVWAQGKQSYGRNAGDTFYFRDDTIYSYGGHFPIARLAKNKKGKKAVLFTTQSRSQTTNGHMALVREALRGLGLPIFYVDDPHSEVTSPMHKSCYKDRIAGALVDGDNARSLRMSHYGRALELTAEANKFSEFFGQRWRLKNPGISPEDRLVAQEAARQERRKALAAQAARRAEMAAENAATVEEWLKGGTYGSAVRNHEETLIRVKGDQVETSRGADIPLEHAKRLWLRIKQCRELGREWQPGPRTVHLGHFELNSISAEGNIVVGCHRIGFSELARIAAQLGLPAVEEREEALAA